MASVLLVFQLGSRIWFTMSRDGLLAVGVLAHSPAVAPHAVVRHHVTVSVRCRR
jgi:hypothetical protein